MDTLTKERAEAEFAIAQRQAEDPISAVVGSALYSARHRFPDLRADLVHQSSMRGGGLTVSRYYFEKGVVVDVIEHPQRFRHEIELKRAYCAQKGLRYVLAPTNFDDEGVRSQLAPVRLPASRPRTTASQPVRKPRTRKVSP